MLFLISYKFTDSKAQDKWSKILKNGTTKEVREIDQRVMMLNWFFLLQHGNGFSVLDADSLETFWKQWSPWRELLEFTIEPCADLDQTVALYC